MGDIKQSFQRGIDKYHPNQCPSCKVTINPKFIDLHELPGVFAGKNIIETMFECTNKKCGRFFIAQYEYDYRMGGYFKLYGSYINYQCSIIEFENEIKDLSSNFINLYNQSTIAEQLGLTDICGCGFRKSLEFLIKDYLKKYEQIDNIEQMTLGNCIKKIDNPKINLVAQRASWLGNDHSHYDTKRSDKDLDDLKILIKLTVHHISSEILTQAYNEDMN